MSSILDDGVCTNCEKQRDPSDLITPNGWDVSLCPDCRPTGHKHLFALDKKLTEALAKKKEKAMITPPAPRRSGKITPKPGKTFMGKPVVEVDDLDTQVGTWDERAKAMAKKLCEAINEGAKAEGYNVNIGSNQLLGALEDLMMRFVGSIADYADKQKARVDELELQDINGTLVKAVNILLKGWPGKALQADEITAHLSLTRTYTKGPSKELHFNLREMELLRKTIKIIQGRSLV